MNNEVKQTVDRVIKVNLSLQSLAINMLDDIQGILDIACKDSTHYSDYLNNYNREDLARLKKALYDVLKTTNSTIYELENEKG